MDEYGESADAALEADETADTADDLGDGMARGVEIEAGTQQSDR